MIEETGTARNTKPARRHFFIFFAAFAFILVLDQWSKWLVRRDIPLNTGWLPEGMDWLKPYARLYHIQNRGASFGMLQDGNLLFIGLSLLIVGGILYYVFHLEHDSPWMWATAGLYLGGAVGNLIDRLAFGAVTDFVSIGSFYIFNVADASINVSVAMLILLWVQEHRQSRKLEASQGGETQ